MTPDALLDAFDAYNAAMVRVAANSQVPLITGEADIPGDARYYVDSAHFTDLGSERMAIRVSDALQESERFRSLLVDSAEASSR